MPKLQMTWPHGTYTKVKERTEAVAHAAKVNNGFETANVTADIQAWLANDGYEVEQQLIARTLDMMHERGWAIRVVKGRRTTGFVLHPDLVVPVPSYVKAKNALATVATRRNGTAPAATPITAAPAGRRAPALPHRAAQPPAVFADFYRLLLDWWRDDPEAAEAYARDAAANLKP